MCRWAIRLSFECSEDVHEELMVCRFGKEEKRENSESRETARRHFDHLFPGDFVMIAVSTFS